MRMPPPAFPLGPRSERAHRGRADSRGRVAVAQLVAGSGLVFGLLFSLSACTPGPLHVSTATAAPAAGGAASDTTDGRKRTPTPVPRAASAAQ